MKIDQEESLSVVSLYPQFHFHLTHKSSRSRARTGSLMTPHGSIETPAFIFCATKATLKGLTMDQVRATGASIILSNTYHLMLQPGPDVVDRLGGLHSFMDWKGPLLTDSGGFQIFSLGYGSVADEIKGRKTVQRPPHVKGLTEEGALFKSYLNGNIHLLTPEKSIEVQQKLGADLIVVLDECTPFHVDKTYTTESMRRSHRWAERCFDFFQKHSEEKQALYGIVQGGVYPELRQESASFVASKNFFGQAIGGSLGASKDQMTEVVEATMPFLNPHRPTHLLGIGGLRDIIKGVTQGIDTFDCVHPTRLARHGGALVIPETEGRENLNLLNSRFREDPQPIDKTCPCNTCSSYSRAYLHHLFKAKEMLGPVALTIHNMTFMNRFLQKIRDDIKQGIL
ncbi:MAG: tRNA guanosine(34) transglycosylase Tgt [Holosporales bacterium]|nr:tRNA guanosine(34) transglycosylase Tgt [Holosporales bacterium]